MATVLFTADLHGNERQYRKLVEYAIISKADYIMIGGDIAPHKMDFGLLVEAQRDFLEHNLPKLFSPLKEKNPKARVFLMMGNDDASYNHDILERDDGKLYELIHNKRVALRDGFDIVGYSYVPITPFSIKDWEKFDLTNVSQDMAQDYLLRKKRSYSLDGFVSRDGRWLDFRFDPGRENEDSIQLDLESEIFTRNPQSTIYVMHSPPFGTSIDKTIIPRAGMLVPTSVGSLAIREFIEKHKPYATLHGHIHESADITGKFKEEIGNTTSILAGNYYDRDIVSVVEFELDDVKNAKRIRL